MTQGMVTRATAMGTHWVARFHAAFLARSFRPVSRAEAAAGSSVVGRSGVKEGPSRVSGRTGITPGSGAGGRGPCGGGRLDVAGDGVDLDPGLDPGTEQAPPVL